MILDSRGLDDGIILSAEVCIVGAGVAGIAMARELEKRSIDTLLLESGGLGPDRQTRDLNRGENAGIPYVFGDGCRSRYLGGSSNCWGGMCRPLGEQDMAQNDWVPDSGWPFGRRSLDPYYERAHAFLNLGPTDYDVERWVEAIAKADVRRIPLPSGRFQDLLTQYTPTKQLGVHYLAELKSARHVRTLLHANVVEICTDPQGRTVSALNVKTLGGRSFQVRARKFVLASGGIENARLLLASNRVQSFGVGNANDLVGRYFADHPRIALGKVSVKPHWQNNRLYNRHLQSRNRIRSPEGTSIRAQFSLRPEVRRNEGLLNAQIWLALVLPGRDTLGADALVRLQHRIRGKSDWDRDTWGDIGRLLRQPFQAAAFAAAWQMGMDRLARDVELEIICEPAPLRDSRVTLAEERDALGVPRVRVDWRLGDQVLRTMDRTLALFAEELRLAEVGEIELPAPLTESGLQLAPPRPWSNLGCWHHMGTTRMHDSERQGVVDRHCKVHGVDNLYVAGSSVFPSYGANFPTLTIAALALRLADHLAEVDAVPIPPVPASASAVS